MTHTGDGPDPVSMTVEEAEVSGGRRLLLYSFEGLDGEPDQGTATERPLPPAVIYTGPSDDVVAPPVEEGESR